MSARSVVWLCTLGLTLTLACAPSFAQTCKILDQDLAAGRYEGACVEGLAHGSGRVRGTGAKPVSYDGEFIRGQKSGRGVKTYANGDTYSGQWLSDLRSGYGIYIYGPGSPWFGDRYEGNWLADKFHGLGSYSWAFGDRYDGDWKDGQQAGAATSAQIQRRRYVSVFAKALAASGNRVCASGARGSSSIFERATALGLFDDRVLVQIDSGSGDGPAAAARWTPIGFWVPCK